MWERISLGRAAHAIGPVVPVLFALAILLTWPLADLSDPRLPDHDDSMFSVWRLAWIAHQLSTDPAHLFDANIFWPEANTLAYSDALLLLGVIGAPLIWLGVHPVVVHNMLLVASFVAAGAAMALLIRHFTSSHAAQLIGAIIFAFAPYRIAHIGHLELLWTALLPLALVCLYRALERPAALRAITLGAVAGLQALCSVYYFVFLAIWMIPAALLAPLHLDIRWSSRHVMAAVLAVLTAAVLVVPYSVPYVRARQELPDRSEREVLRYSARPADYLRAAATNRVYPTFASDAPDERSLFVGTTAFVLAALAVVVMRTRTALVWCGLALIAMDLSFGVNGFTYTALRDLLPPLGGFRAPARFGVFVLLAVSGLAGLAVARLVATGSRRRRRVMTAGLVGLLVFEYWSVPVGTREQPLQPPEVYQWLSAQPQTVVLELPVPRPDGLWLYETTSQYLSIYHWQPLVNGYSGYAPPSYIHLLEVMRRFPSNESIRLLKDQGVELILIHELYLDPSEFESLVAACNNSSSFASVAILLGARGRTAACRLI